MTLAERRELRSQIRAIRDGVFKMKTYKDTAYTLAAVSAAVAAFRVLIKKGLITHAEATEALLAEAELHQDVIGETTTDMNAQAVEILKFIAEKL